MPHYFFDSDEDGIVYSDDQGTLYDDFPLVRKEALRTLAEMARDGLPHRRIAVKVRDGRGGLVLEVALTFAVETRHFDERIFQIDLRTNRRLDRHRADHEVSGAAASSLDWNIRSP